MNNVSLDSNSSTNYSDLFANDIANDSETSVDHVNKLRIRNQNENIISNKIDSINLNGNNNNNSSNKAFILNESLDNSSNQYTSISNGKKNFFKNSSTSSVTSSEDVISSSATSSNFLKTKEFTNKSIEIDNEINKLRKEAAAKEALDGKKGLTSSYKQQPTYLNDKLLTNSNTSSRKTSFNLSFNSNNGVNSNSMHTNEHLNDISPTKFDKKIQDLEEYSTIIENAASKMDECVKSMTEVYQSYDERNFYVDSPSTDEMLLNESNNSIKAANESVTNNIISETTTTTTTNTEVSLYDQAIKLEDSLKIENKPKVEHDVNIDTLTSFDEKLKFDLKQEIKIDNNTKLMFMMNIFQNDHNEELIKVNTLN